MVYRQSLTPGERKLYSKLHGILTRPGLVRGNLVEMKRSCGKRGCRCQKDPSLRHRSLYLAIRKAGVQRMIYIPKEWEKDVKDWVNRYKEVRAVLEKLSLVFLGRIQKREG